MTTIATTATFTPLTAAARQLTHHLANPPGETAVTTKGGFGENQ